ncbi:hypothetical protein VTK73DRAFT_7170 [Phialemonium thermophilum]|uniref:Transcription factor IIA, alpha/beta subunit n=1 Tax=Phialemonium thermophilum TaxID=223376 RepID=A0ABR3XTP8_9PEZI
MSNSQVGAVYAQIIEDVIESSRVDFEEGGVEEAVLQELQRGWQQKLSQLNVAQFPWDPKPEAESTSNGSVAPVPTAAPPAAPPANSYSHAQSHPPQNGQSLSFPGAPVQSGTGEPEIKTEPGLARVDPAIKQEPGLSSNGGPSAHPSYSAGLGRGIPLAQQRAAQALESQYGQRAAASITAMAQASQLGPNVAQQPQRPGQQQPLGHPQQYRQGVPAAMTAQQQQQQQRAQQAAANVESGVATSQVDGSAPDFEGVMMQRGADGKLVEMGRVEIDSYLHAQIASNAKLMEGGGLMLPLAEATRHKGVVGKKTQSQATKRSSQVDGPNEDVKLEEEDEDAINSDLDDPEDDQEDDDEEDESLGHIMLCMYDKVQRVKNKWKCTLKDGVLTVNGKEYVFHKATGEYEW